MHKLTQRIQLLLLLAATVVVLGLASPALATDRTPKPVVKTNQAQQSLDARAAAGEQYQKFLMWQQQKNGNGGPVIPEPTAALLFAAGALGVSRTLKRKR